LNGRLVYSFIDSQGEKASMRKCMSAIVMALLVLTGVASAQETTGTLSGRLVDTQGLAVPGATVTVTGPQGARSFVTDENGRFSAPFLTPGVYDVRAELQGFKAVQVDDVTVSLGQTSEISLRMEVGGLTETVQVVGSTAIVDTTSTTVGATITSEMLSRIPVGRRFSDTLYLAPGVSSSGSAGRANPSMSGGTGLDNQYVVDGVNVTNQGYGALGSYSIVFGSLGNATPFDFIKEVQVKTGGYEAEFGQSMGGVVNVVTKSGSNNVRGSLFGYTQPGALEGEYKTFQSVNGTVNTVGQERSDVGLEIGGPIIQNRMFFFGALNPSWETRTFIAPTDAENFAAAALGEIDRERRTVSYSAKTTFQINAQNRIDASFFGDPSKGPMGPQRTSALLGPVLASGQLEQYSELTKFGGHNQTVRYDGVVSPTWLVEASFARAVNDIEEVPLVDEWRYRDFTVTPTRITGGIGFFEAGNHSLNNQWSIKSTHILRGHEVKYGFAFDDVEYSQLNQRTGPTFTTSDGRQTATGAQVDVIADPAFGRIYRVIRANYTDTRDTEQTYWNFFVQDQWRASSRLTINAGLRYEQESLIGTFSELHTLDGQTLDAFDLKGNWAPRIGFVYDVLGNGRSKLFGNWGRFFARLPNDIAARALSADEGVSRADYFDAALTQPIPNGVLAGGVTEHLALAGAHPSLIDPDAKLSYKDEFAAGFEWEAFPNTNVGIRYVHRNIGRAIEDVAAAPLAAYDLGLPGAESTEYILTNPDEDFPTAFPELGASFEKPVHNYDAVELTVDRRFSNNWSLMGSYRWSRLFGTYEGFFREDNGQSDPGLTSLYDFPTNDPSYTQIGVPQFGYRGDIRYLGELGEGPLPLDRPHQFKLFGNYSMDNGLGIGLGLTASSGKPFTALAGNSWYGNGGEIPETPRGEGFETVDGFRKRTPMEFHVDKQASYNVRVFGERRLTLLADAFNLFNLRRTIDYNTYTELIFGEPNPDFGTPTSQNVSGQMFQNPFQLRLGARFEW
jgi:hypothetical protein